jgi:hypothetical protein
LIALNADSLATPLKHQQGNGVKPAELPTSSPVLRHQQLHGLSENKPITFPPDRCSPLNGLKEPAS